MYRTQRLVRISHLLLSLTLLLHPLFTLTLSKLCNPYDEKVLLQIKKQFGNPSSLSSWDSSTDCCIDWGPVMSCDEKGHVLELTLDLQDDASGPVSPAIGDLIFLRTLWLQYYNVPGPFPLAICKLSNLLDLSIVLTRFTGPIPSCLGQLKNLTHLEIAHNGLITGRIPKALAQLTSLNVLALYSNKLSGQIPKVLGRMPSLRWLDLDSNRLQGPIPASLGQLPNLAYLVLSGNRLTGSIPDSFGSFKKPIDIWLDGNRLTGPIPRTMRRLNASSIDLSSNKLTGDATFLFGRKKILLTINLSNNHFKFNLSKVHFPVLYNLNISHNMIYGSLPKQLSKLPLESIDVSYNQLCGPIPVSQQQFKPEYFAHNKCLCGRPLGACK